MTTPMVVPVLRLAEDVVQVLLADHAERIQHLLLERLDYTLDKCL